MQGRVTSQGRYARRVSPLLRSAMQPRSGRPDPRHRGGSAPAGGADGAINARVPESAPVSAAGAGRRAACKRPGPWVAGRRCHPERCIVTGMQRSSWESIEPMAPTPINRAAITASPHWRRHRASREGRQRPAAGATPRRGQLPVRIAPVRDFRSFVLADWTAHRTGKIPSSARAKTGFSRDTCKNAPYNLFSLVDSFGCRIFLGASSVSAIGSQLRQQLLQRGHTHVGPQRLGLCLFATLPLLR